MPNNDTDFQYQIFHVIKIILFLGELLTSRNIKISKKSIA